MSKNKYTEEQHELIKKLAADRIDVVFICAIKDEFDRFVKQLDHLKKPHAPYRELKKLNGYTYERFILEAAGKEIQCVVVMQRSDGMVACSCLCSRILQYSPKLVVMSGICGGVTGKINRGDLVMATMAFDYGAGKHYSDGRFVPKYLPVTQEDENLLEAAERTRLELMDILEMGCPPDALVLKQNAGAELRVQAQNIKFHQGPMGTGAAVVNQKSIIVDAQGHQRNLLAYDMEAYALGYMCDNALNKRVPWLIVKGVQDLYDTPDDQKDEYNKLASFASAAFVISAAKHFMELSFEDSQDR